MINKIKNYVILILSVFLILLYFLFRYQTKDLKRELIKYKLTLKDSLVKEKERLFISYQREYDSLLLIKNKTIYVPYKKYVYMDRSLDEALDVFAAQINKGYTRTTKKNR